MARRVVVKKGSINYTPCRIAKGHTGAGTFAQEVKCSGKPAKKSRKTRKSKSRKSRKSRKASKKKTARKTTRRVVKGYFRDKKGRCHKGKKFVKNSLCTKYRV